MHTQKGDPFRSASTENLTGPFLEYVFKLAVKEDSIYTIFYNGQIIKVFEVILIWE